MDDDLKNDEIPPIEARESAEAPESGSVKSEAKKRDWLDWIQAFILLGTAAFGLWLKIEQASLARGQEELKKEQVQLNNNLEGLKAKQAAVDLSASREKITAVFTDKLLTQIEKLTFKSGTAKEAFILELMEVDISAHLLESGDVNSNEMQRVTKECRLIPQRIALYTGNTEAVSFQDRK